VQCCHHVIGHRTCAHVCACVCVGVSVMLLKRACCFVCVLFRMFCSCGILPPPPTTPIDHLFSLPCVLLCQTLPTDACTPATRRELSPSSSHPLTSLPSSLLIKYTTCSPTPHLLFSGPRFDVAEKCVIVSNGMVRYHDITSGSPELKNKTCEIVETPGWPSTW